MKRKKINWMSNFIRWITYYKYDLSRDYVDVHGRCGTCDAMGECIRNFDCPCSPYQQLRHRPITNLR
jgi:hypothetical protein